jgi:SAM-dependent methyltransferase
MTRRDAPATQRNRDPILEVLARWLDAPARVLEIASGTGQHAVYFAGKLPHVSWQPSDSEATALSSIRAWVDDEGGANVAQPIELDTTTPDWGVARVDAIFNANMIHISPWSVAEGLFAGAERVLEDGGLLFLYGPFRVDGTHTSESNAAFDTSLKSRNESWGVRDLAHVEALAKGANLVLAEINEMPAHNKFLVFRRAKRGDSSEGRA